MLDHNAWLIKANHDLKAARKLTKPSSDETEELLLDIAIYHAQQSAEKALKGFLVFKKQCIEKTHDLEFLVKECEDVDFTFSALRKEVVFLNPYATAFRYPTRIMMPTPDECYTAIKHASKIFNFIKEKIENEHGEVNLDIFSYIKNQKKY